MTVTKIVDRQLTIDITDPKLKYCLSWLDNNDDGTVDIKDFGEGKESEMREAIANNLYGTGFISYKQISGVKRFFDLYNNVLEANKIVSDWGNHNTDTPMLGFIDGTEMEFPFDYWQSNVLPHITGDGLLSSKPRYLDYPKNYARHLYTTDGNYVAAGLSADMFNVMTELTGDLKEWKYDQNAVPEFMKDSVDKLLVQWNGITQALHQQSSSKPYYYEIECDGDSRCSTFDDFRIFALSIYPKEQ